MPYPTSLDRIANPPSLSAHRSLTDAVHAVLRDEITNGVLGPGTRLPEVALAQRFSVSATPVREALRRLGEEGLVETRPHRGAIVVLCTRADLGHLYEIHEVLESHAAASAASRVASDPSVPVPADLPELLAAMDQVLGNQDQTLFNRIDLAFHRTLNALGGNDLLTDQIEQVHRRIQSARMTFDVHLPDRPAHSQVEHRALHEAVLAGEVERARTVARAHIRTVRDHVMALLEKEGAADPQT